MPLALSVQMEMATFTYAVGGMHIWAGRPKFLCSLDTELT